MDHDVAPEVWDFIYLALGTALPKDWVVIRWMPGHLDSKSKRKLRDELIAKGTLSWGDIKGNIAVDRLADAAAKRHDFPLSMHDDAYIRRDVTVATQKHLVRSWLFWCDLHREAREQPNKEDISLLGVDQQEFATRSRDAQGQFVEDWEASLPDLLDDPFENLVPQIDDSQFDDSQWDAPVGMMDLDGNDLCQDYSSQPLAPAQAGAVSNDPMAVSTCPSGTDQRLQKRMG